MPFAIDEERFKQIKRFDVSAPPNSPSGIPMKQIPYMEFPRAIYKHPTEPYRKVEHRNALHEVVDVETVPAEALCRVVNDAKELAQALKEGWLKEPYAAPPLPDPNAHLYEST